MSSSTDTTQYVNSNYITPNVVENREYQSRLVDAAESQSTLVALPTGTGKTPVAIRIAMRRLDMHGGRVLMLAPTNPLIEQHKASFEEMTTIPENEIEVFNGSVAPDKREKLWGQAKSVIIATPQVLENDLMGNRYNLSEVTHLIFDECHRATGDYAYNYIGERYERDAPADTRVVTAMSASPGKDKQKILEVCENLRIENVEIITEDDANLQEHQSTTEYTERWLEMPDALLDAADLVKQAYKEPQKQLKQLRITVDGEQKPVLASAKKDQSFHALQRAMGRATRSEESAAYQARSYCAEAMKLNKIIDAIESQSIGAAISTIDRAIENGSDSNSSKASQRIASNPKIKKARQMLAEFDGVHPKLMEILGQSTEYMHGDGRVLVFTENRDTVQSVVEFLNRGTDADVARRFVGQSDRGTDDTGMSQAEQTETLNAFRNGDFSILVSTAVGEEGIDIPAVDIVIMYEPVPSGIRDTQRSGRTGREADGEVITLIGEKTADVGKYYAAKNREDTMRSAMSELKDMEGDLNTALEDLRTEDSESVPDEQTNVSAFTESETRSADSEPESDTTTNAAESATDDSAVSDSDTPVSPDVSGSSPGSNTDTEDVVDITVDTREFNSDVPKELDRNTVVRSTPETLPTADYVVSDRVGVERKTGPDFLDTILGERGFGQVKELSNAYESPTVFIEEDGVSDLFTIRNVHPNAIRGALASIQLDYGVTIYFTGDASGTAEMLVSLAKREQHDHDRAVDAHGEKETTTQTEQQIYIVSSMAGIGPKTARSLLDGFGSVRSVMNASMDELMGVDGVGMKTAERIVEDVTATYSPE